MLTPDRFSRSFRTGCGPEGGRTKSPAIARPANRDESLSARRLRYFLSPVAGVVVLVSVVVFCSPALVSVAGLLVAVVLVSVFVVVVSAQPTQNRPKQVTNDSNIPSFFMDAPLDKTVCLRCAGPPCNSLLILRRWVLFPTFSNRPQNCSRIASATKGLRDFDPPRNFTPHVARGPGSIAGDGGPATPRQNLVERTNPWHLGRRLGEVHRPVWPPGLQRDALLPHAGREPSGTAADRLYADRGMALPSRRRTIQ